MLAKPEQEGTENYKLMNTMAKLYFKPVRNIHQSKRAHGMD
jgi:hypothetical protein